MAMEEIELLMNSEPAIVMGAIAAWLTLAFMRGLVAWRLQRGAIWEDDRLKARSPVGASARARLKNCLWN